MTGAVGSSRVPSFPQDTYLQRGAGCEVKEMHEVRAPFARFSGRRVVWDVGTNGNLVCARVESAAGVIFMV